MSKLFHYAKPSRLLKRRGSVLILCVVLIVVLALIGTAMLSTARIDRFTATQHGYNTQIELLIEGAKQIAKGVIVADLYGQTSPSEPPRYRPPLDTSATANPNYDHWDAPVISNNATLPLQNDQWLSAGFPTMHVDASSGTPTPVSEIYWPAISGPIAAATFEAPDTGPITGAQPRAFMAPTIKTINYPDGSQRRLPALVNLENTGQVYLAGDADGDGIADGLMTRLVPGEINGVVYFVTYRIVDNAAKINLNTAWSRANDFQASAGRVAMFDPTVYGPANVGSFAANMGIFPSHVGALELLWRRDPTQPAHNDQNAFVEMLALNQYRMGYAPTQILTDYRVSLDNPLEDADISPNYPNPSRNPRTDFDFVSMGEALAMQLACRLDNPGYNTLSSGGEAQYRAFPASDSAALAYRGGVLLNLEASLSTVEDAFANAWRFSPGAINPDDPDSIVKLAPNYVRTTGQQFSRVNGQKQYRPDQLALWFDQNYNQDGVYGSFNSSVQTYTLTLDDPANPENLPSNYQPFPHSKRPFFTTMNPVSNQITARGMAGAGTVIPSVPAGMEVYRAIQPKTNVNTAKFEELWRAFWCVMAEGPNNGPPFTGTFDPAVDSVYQGMEFSAAYPFDPDPLIAHHPLVMFRSVVREPRAQPNPDSAHIEGPDMMRLRAAMAATQTIRMRDPSAANSIRIPVPISVKTGAGNIAATAYVYGLERQPFITEVYAQTDTQTLGPGGAEPPYVCIELYNPYPDDIVLDSNYRLVTVDRRATLAQYPLAAPTTIHTFSTSATVPAGGYLLLENYNELGGGTRTTRPVSSGIQTITPRPDLNIVYVQDLNHCIGSPTLAEGTELILVHDIGGSGNLDELLPVDSFDFTGATPALATAWHYARANDSTQKRWHWVYPGRYDGLRQAQRHQGTQYVEWFPVQGETDPWENSPPDVAITLGNVNPTATYPRTFPIQLDEPNRQGPNDLLTTTPKRFPFGGFARNGDILRIPYIAAYTIVSSSGELIEMNSISMDAAFAEDSTVADDPPATGDTGSAAREQIGRFCPIAHVTDGTNIVDDYSATPAEFRYAWAADLFDYLTVQAPSHDSLPNYDRTIYTANAGRAPQPIKNGLFAPATDENPAPPGTAALGTEDTVPLHGLININTAPWYVLSAIPWVKGCSPGATDDRFAFNESTGVFSQAVNGIDDNIDIAKAIVLWRDGVPNSPATANGPFKTIFDIYKVTDRTSPARNIFRYIQDDITKGGTTDPDDAEGDFTPYNLSVPAPTTLTDNVKFDFEDQYLILTRISNLITTRSDSFTVYILVQGWTGVGTVAPELVVQRRAAFILDRSPATPESSAVNTINVPND